MWIHLRYFQRKLGGEEPPVWSEMLPVHHRTECTTTLRSLFKLRGENREAENAMESINLPSGDRAAEMATEETRETEDAWHVVEEEVNLEYILDKLHHVRLTPKLNRNFLSTDVGKAMLQLACGYHKDCIDCAPTIPQVTPAVDVATVPWSRQCEGGCRNPAYGQCACGARIC